MMEMLVLMVTMMVILRDDVVQIRAKLTRLRLALLQKFQCKLLQMHCVAKNQNTLKKLFGFWILY